MTLDEFNLLVGLPNAPTTEEFYREIGLRYSQCWPAGEKSDPRYETNSQGFRGGEHLSTVDIGYFGCSLTYGIGCTNSELWCSVVDVHERTTSNNYGIPSIGIQEIAEIFLGATRLTQIKCAMILLPDIVRVSVPVEVAQDIQFWQLLPGISVKHTPLSVQEAARAWFTMPELFWVELARRNIMRIEARAQQLGIKTIYSSWSERTYELLGQLPIRLVEFCRSDCKGFDNIHPSPEANWSYAQIFRKGL